MEPGSDGHAGASPLRALLYPNGITSVLELHGDGDISTRATLRELLTDAFKHHPQVLVIDLHGLGFCDAGCAQDLLTVARLRCVGLARARGVVAKVLNLVDPAPNLGVYWASRPLAPSEPGPTDEGQWVAG